MKNITVLNNIKNFINNVKCNVKVSFENGCLGTKCNIRYEMECNLNDKSSINETNKKWDEILTNIYNFFGTFKNYKSNDIVNENVDYMEALSFFETKKREISAIVSRKIEYNQYEVLKKNNFLIVFQFDKNLTEEEKELYLKELE